MRFMSLNRSGLNAPARASDIAAAEAALDAKFPSDLCDFYLYSNGFNGAIGMNQRYLRLHPLVGVVSTTTGYDVAGELGLILIGDNGGDYGYALRRSAGLIEYVGLSSLSACLDELNFMGRTFDEFLQAFGQ